jgi:hypothetical protein
MDPVIDGNGVKGDGILNDEYGMLNGKKNNLCKQ